MPIDPSIEEELVRLTVRQALGVPVEQHDDQSQPGMYDLDICYSDRPWAALEVTSDVDRMAMSTLGTLDKRNRSSWESSRITRDWGLYTTSHVSVRALEREVEDALALFEQSGLHQLDEYALQERYAIAMLTGARPDAVVTAWAGLHQAGVISAYSYEAAGKPTVSVYTNVGGGGWNGDPDVVVPWIEGFCRDPERADNLLKLSRAADIDGAHLAVLARLRDDLFEVWSALDAYRRPELLPTRAPTLPSPITAVWLFARPPRGSSALTWSQGNGWRRVQVVEPS